MKSVSNPLDALALAAAIQSGEMTAKHCLNQTLERIQSIDPDLNCFTAILSDTAMATADEIDQKIQTGHHLGPLVGVPFAVKNLFDIRGLSTLAGSKINQTLAPATQDATVIRRLKAAGAILIGALNMDEYAYGFTTENAHYGSVRNPHDRARMAGGSSGGSAAAVAGGLVPFTLGSDTNGSIRVPASLCGVFGLKPTYGRLSRAGTVLFAPSFDHVGPLARSVGDLAAVYDVMQGPDPADPVCTHRPPELCLPQLQGNLIETIRSYRMGLADGYFKATGVAEVAVNQVAETLRANQRITLPEAHRARAAAYMITASEGANQHLTHLQTRPHDFDPATRDRFLAGLLIPGQWILQAQRFRAWYQQQVRQIFASLDVLIAPTTPCPAPRLGQTMMRLDGEEVSIRPNLGLFTQPISFIGLPVLSVPVVCPGSLPIGVQLIAAPYHEHQLFQVAAFLEQTGIASAPIAMA